MMADVSCKYDGEPCGMALGNYFGDNCPCDKVKKGQQLAAKLNRNLCFNPPLRLDNKTNCREKCNFAEGCEVGK